MLICKPALVFCYRCCAVAVGTDPKRIAPLAAAPDIDRARGHAFVMLVENPAHRQRLSISVCGERSAGRGSGARVTNRVSRWGTACPLTGGPPRPARPRPIRRSRMRDAAGFADVTRAIAAPSG